MGKYLLGVALLLCPLLFFSFRTSTVVSDGATSVSVATTEMKSATDNPMQNAFAAYTNNIFITTDDSNASPTVVPIIAKIIKSYSVPVLQSTLTGQLTKPIHIRLFFHASDYAVAVKTHYPALITTTVEANSMGFTSGTTIFIPLYEYETKEGQFVRADLANALTHELTHATMNVLNVNLPTWLNEGYAWQNGLLAEAAIDHALIPIISNSNYYDMEQASTLLIPLTHNEEQIFLTKYYNVEWEDYAAVAELINDYGLNKFKQFVLLTTTESNTKAFQTVFSMSISEYENLFYSYNSSP